VCVILKNATHLVTPLVVRRPRSHNNSPAYISGTQGPLVRLGATGDLKFESSYHLIGLPRHDVERRKENGKQATPECSYRVIVALADSDHPKIPSRIRGPSTSGTRSVPVSVGDSTCGSDEKQCTPNQDKNILYIISESASTALAIARDPSW